MSTLLAIKMDIAEIYITYMMHLSTCLLNVNEMQHVCSHGD